MKSFNSSKACGLLVICMVAMFTLANAQTRYKHVPRVKTDNSRVLQKNENKLQKSKLTTPVTTTFDDSKKNESVITMSNISSENTNVASSTQEAIIVTEKVNSKVKDSETIKSNKKTNKYAFSEKIKAKSQILNVKEVKKTALLGYLLWFFVVLFLCVAFFVLAFLFFQTFFSIYPIFLTLAIVVFAIAVVILIFGLTGLI